MRCIRIPQLSRRDCRGFSLFELLIVVPVMALVVLLIIKFFWSISKSTARAGTGAAELTLATRMAEIFRDDARQALRAEVPASGESAKLTLPGMVVEYKRNSNGRLERISWSGPDSDTMAGPSLLNATFSMKPVNGSNRLPLLCARWTCSEGVEAPAVPSSPRGKPASTQKVEPPKRIGRVLVLDTALRCCEVKP